MNLKIIMLNEKKRQKKYTLYDFIYIKILENANQFIVTENSGTVVEVG